MGAARQVYEQVVECFNQHDLEALRSLVVDDVVAGREGSGAGQRQGADDAMSYAVKLWQAFPDIQMRPTRFIEAGDDLAVQFDWTGTSTGPLPDGKGGTRPPSGRRVSGGMVHVCGVRDGKLVSTELYERLSRSVEDLDSGGTAEVDPES